MTIYKCDICGKEAKIYTVGVASGLFASHGAWMEMCADCIKERLPEIYNKFKQMKEVTK